MESNFATYRDPSGTRYVPTCPETERLVRSYRDAMYAWAEEAMRDRGWSGAAEDQAAKRAETALSALQPWIRYGRVKIERTQQEQAA